MAKRYRIFSWNVNGIRAAQKKGLLGWMAEAKPDVLCLQETKAMPEQLDKALTEPEGCSADYAWAEKKGYSGVATFSKPKPLGFKRGLGKKEYDAEGRVLRHDFPEFQLYNIYFPNGKARQERLDYKMRFYEDFLKKLKRRKKADRIVICGDVNTAHKEIDLARPKANEDSSGFLPMERDWIDRLLRAGFVDSFREFEKGPGHYTWWDLVTRARDRNVGWRIDYFFISENLRKNLKGAAIHAGVMGSDHCPVSIDLRF